MKAATIAIAVSALAVGGLGWFDTARYRSARQAYEAVVKERLPQRQAQWQQDEARYKRCDPMRAENTARNTIDFTPEGRRCLIDALDQTGSVQGALLLVRNASVALGKDPDDQALRAAALGAIATARRILASDKPWRYDRLEQVQGAYATSLVMRVLAEPQPASGSFAAQATLLDEAEYSIHLPRLYQSQQIWRLEALLPEKT